MCTDIPFSGDGFRQQDTQLVRIMQPSVHGTGASILGELPEMPFISPGKHIPKRAEMQITDVNNIRFRNKGHRRTGHPSSGDTVFFQLVIQGCPANTEYPGRTDTIPVGSLKRGKNQLLFLLLFRQDRHLILSHTQVQFQ